MLEAYVKSPTPTPAGEWCFAIAPESKYYRRDNTLIKRSLRPREYMTTIKGDQTRSLKNEAASLRFVRGDTGIPVPNVLCDFEDDEAHYVITGLLR